MPEVDRMNAVEQQAIHETPFVFRFDHKDPRTGARWKPSERARDNVAELHQQALVVPASAFGCGRVDEARKQKPGRSGRRTIGVSQRMGIRRRIDPVAGALERRAQSVLESRQQRRPCQQPFCVADADHSQT